MLRRSMTVSQHKVGLRLVVERMEERCRSRSTRHSLELFYFAHSRTQSAVGHSFALLTIALHWHYGFEPFQFEKCDVTPKK